MHLYYTDSNYPALCSLVAAEGLWQQTSKDLYDILIDHEVFTSRSQAKKNFKLPLPVPGFNFYYGVGKRKENIIVYLPGVDFSPEDFDTDEAWARLAVKLGLVRFNGQVIRDPDFLVGSGVLDIVTREM